MNNNQRNEEEKEEKDIVERKEKEYQFLDDQNLGFGIGKCLIYLGQNPELLNDGLEEEENDDIDIDRYDDLGKKIKPYEQYKMMCHQFHGKKPRKNNTNKKLGKMNKMKAQDILKMRMSLNDTPLGMMQSTQKMLKKQQKPFINAFFEKKE